MKKLLILCSHVPNPRMIKRIISLRKIFSQVNLLFLKRDFWNGFNFSGIDGVYSEELNATANPTLVTRILENTKLVNQTRTKLESIGPDLVYVSGVELLLALKNSQKSNYPVVCEIADIPGNNHIVKHKIIGHLMEKYITELIKKRTDYLVFTSQGYYDKYYKLKGLSDKEFFIFENLPLKSIFGEYHETTDQIRSEGKLVIGYIGAVAYYRSLRTLFEACSDFKNVEIIVAGKGPDYEKVKEEAKKYNNVMVTGQYDYERDILRLYSSVDVVYSVYNTDNFNVRLALPNKLYESIVCGKPIIVASGTYLEEYVKKLGVGFSVPYNDVESLRELINNILNHRDQLCQISERCIKIREDYFYENTEAKFLEWLDRIVCSYLDVEKE